MSRAAKEHERRGGQREGFSVAPGDCLAFKYYRDVSCSLLPSLVREQSLTSLTFPCPRDADVWSLDGITVFIAVHA